MTLAAGLQEHGRVTIVADTRFREFLADGSTVYTCASKFRWCGPNVLCAWAGFRFVTESKFSVDLTIGSRAAARLAFDQATAEHRAAGKDLIDRRPDLKAYVEADPTPEFLAVVLGRDPGPDLIRITGRGEESARNGQVLSVGPWPDLVGQWRERGTPARVLLLEAMERAIEAQQGRRTADFPLDVWTLVGNDATHERMTKWEVLAAITVEQETERFLSRKG